MEIAEVFGVPICIHQLETIDVDKVKKYMDDENVDQIYPGQMDIVLEAELEAEVLDITLQYSNNVLGHQVPDVQFAAIWGNITRPEKVVNKHTHSNSYLSGCFYMTEGSNINFYNPLEVKDMFMLSPEATYDPSNKHTWKAMNVNPVPGRLLIFPSGLPHSVDKSFSDRYSIAYNIMPKGLMGRRTTKLDIDSYK